MCDLYCTNAQGIRAGIEDRSNIHKPLICKDSKNGEMNESKIGREDELELHQLHMAHRSSSGQKVAAVVILVVLWCEFMMTE